jgi:tryptophan synthase alpha subunit
LHPARPAPGKAPHVGWQLIEQRLQERRRRQEIGFIPYLTVGYPDLKSTIPLVTAIAQAGADVIELGVPFSDPLADGPTIQRSTFSALRQGVTFNICLDTVRAIRAAGVTVPIVFMGYYNSVLAHGLDASARDAAAAGADGFIVADLPHEEAAPFHAACSVNRLALVPLLAPTSNHARVAAACKDARGFVYCVSLTGVTGARESIASEAEALVARARKHTSLPVAVGFGVSRKEHALAIGKFSDAVVVGSALIDLISKSSSRDTLPNVHAFVAELAGLSKPVSGAVR